MRDNTDAPPWVAEDRHEPEPESKVCLTCSNELETVEFQNVRQELEALEKRVKWKRRFKFLFSSVFLLTFAILIYLMPLSIGLSIISLGGMFVSDQMTLRIAAVLGAAASGLLISTIIGLGRFTSLGLAAGASAPLIYVSSIKAMLLAHIPF